VTPPVVSVLLPAFDAEATLPACLGSLVRQREARWECVLVDDGSRDGTLARARAFAARDPRIRVVATAHGGLVAALAAGLAHCRGRFVARMDADDVMHRDRLDAQRRALEADPGLAAVGCHVRLFPRAALRDGLRAYERWLAGVDTPRRIREEAFVECPVAHPTLMIRREALAAFGYRDVGWPEDWDLVLRLLGAGHAIGIVPRRLLLWRDHPRRLTRTDPRYARDRLTACRAAFLARDFLRDRPSYVLWGYGGTGRALRRALLAHGKRPSHVVEVHAGRVGQRIHGAPVLGVEELLRRPRVPLVASVAGAEPRRQIREALAAAGLEETRDFVCAA
jgi:glycosyltransferase involved in cell wall biosynthesis